MVLSTQYSHRQLPAPSASPQRVKPLRVIGEATTKVFNQLGVPDHFHNNIWDVVESTTRGKWKSTILGLGMGIGEEDAHAVISAMESDITELQDC